MSSDVIVHGSLFNGVASHLMAKAVDAATDQVAAQASSEWHTFLDGSIRHPTPYYEAQIHTVDRGFYTRSVNDRGVIYGPWLEGTGSRNSPVTRFPGYHSRERAVAAIGPQIKPLTEKAIAPYVAEANR